MHKLWSQHEYIPFARITFNGNLPFERTVPSSLFKRTSLLIHAPPPLFFLLLPSRLDAMRFRFSETLCISRETPRSINSILLVATGRTSRESSLQFRLPRSRTVTRGECRCRSVVQELECCIRITPEEASRFSLTIACLCPYASRKRNPLSVSPQDRREMVIAIVSFSHFYHCRQDSPTCSRHNEIPYY